jgi:hypothetical protein
MEYDLAYRVSVQRDGREGQVAANFSSLGNHLVSPGYIPSNQSPFF